MIGIYLHRSFFHIYDTKVYQGHSEFVARGLGRKIRFAEFKNLSRQSKKREYMPFFLYDLNSKPFKKINRIVLIGQYDLENYAYDDDAPNHLLEEIIKLSKMVSQLDKKF